MKFTFEVVLFKVTDTLTKEYQYCYAPNHKPSGYYFVRRAFANQDHGGMDQEIFARICSSFESIVEKITHIDQVPEDDRMVLPYHADYSDLEIGNDIEDILDRTIEEFLVED